MTGISARVLALYAVLGIGIGLAVGYGFAMIFGQLMRIGSTKGLEVMVVLVMAGALMGVIPRTGTFWAVVDFFAGEKEDSDTL
jgi:hypothetical protein